MNKKLTTVFLSVFAALSVLPAAQPEAQNIEALVTLTAPVAIQGVLLPAGRYVFKQAGDHIVQVFNEDQSDPLTAFAIVSAVDESAVEPATSNCEDDAVDEPGDALETEPDAPFNVIVIPPPEDEDATTAPSQPRP